MSFRAFWRRNPVHAPRARLALVAACLVVALPLSAQVGTGTNGVDYDAIYKIKDEGFQRSQVMDTPAGSPTSTDRGSPGRPTSGRGRLGREEADRVGRRARAPRDVGHVRHAAGSNERFAANVV